MINIRKAKHQDLEAIIRLLAEDDLGSQREIYSIPLLECYHKAFEAILATPNTELIVMELENKIIGTLQLTFTQHLIYQGARRASIEAVRISEGYRGQGFGTKLLQWAIQRAKDMNCHMAQLTTNKIRKKAQKFYIDLGFVASHEGMKLML